MFSDLNGTNRKTLLLEKINHKKAMEAARKIQSFMFLKAWRHQREKNANLSKQVENLQMQTYALKQLLNAEKTRVAQANGDLRKLLNALEEFKFEKKSLINEKEQLENRLHLMEEQILSANNECKNKKNELMTARLEAQNWEKQLEKEREKLTRLKDEKKFFLEDVRFKGNLLVWQITSFEQVSWLFSALQGKPYNPALPWKDAVGRNDHQISESSKAVKIPKRHQTIIVIEKSGESLDPNVVLAKVGRKLLDEEDEKIEESEKSILRKMWVMLKNY